jgi:hypothetical protein
VGGVGQHKKRVNEGEYGGYISYSYENRRMRPVEIVLRRWRGNSENDKGGKSN